MKIVLTVAFSALIITPCVAAPEFNAANADPHAITCQKAQPIPNMAMVRDKPVCKSNAEWARIEAAQVDLAQDQIRPRPNSNPFPVAINNR